MQLAAVERKWEEGGKGEKKKAAGFALEKKKKDVSNIRAPARAIDVFVVASKGVSVSLRAGLPGMSTQ